MERPRAADDFEVIRERLEELRREREEIAPTGDAATETPPSGDGAPDADSDREAHGGCAPVGWAATIFLPQPTD